MSSEHTSSSIIKSGADGRILCRIDILFRETRSQLSRFGSIQISIVYKKNQKPDNPINRHVIKQSWWKEAEDDFRMGITFFSVPVCLRSHSISQYIWSEIYAGLPEDIRDRLYVFGSLNSGDSLSPVSDFNTTSSDSKNTSSDIPTLMNQIDRRNRLWKSILCQNNNSRTEFTCDKDGNGSFYGYLTDPLRNKANIPIISQSAKTLM